MRLRVIACEVLTREVCWCVARSPHVCNIEFLPKHAHNEPESFRKLIQTRIDEVDDQRPRDAIVLVMGLCGNATAGIHAPDVPLIIPRAHDCCTLFLGSKAAFRTHFEANPSRPFASTGYCEHDGDYDPTERNITAMGVGADYATYVEQYGEENATFIWESLNPTRGETDNDHTTVFIDVPETSRPGDETRCREQAATDGYEFLRLERSLSLVRDLLEGRWPDDEFLTVQPGQVVKAKYDWDEIIEAAPEPTQTDPQI